MIVVQDNDFLDAIERLVSAGFHRSVPNRTPRPEIIVRHPNPQQMLEAINAGYKRLDNSCVTLDYPHGDPAEIGLQVYVFPDSFAHIFPEDGLQSSNQIRETTASIQRFQTYGNLHFPLEQALVESFVKAAIDEETSTEVSAWGQSLRSWVSLMVGYLDVDNDILDYCPDK